MTKCGVLILTLALLTFGWRRTLSYLRFFQQEEYNKVRFLAWLKHARAIDRRGSVVLIATALCALLSPAGWFTLLLCIAAAVTLVGTVLVRESDPRSSGKLRLVMTQRASKIAAVAYTLFVLLALLPLLVLLASCCGRAPSLTLIALLALPAVQAPPLLLIAANKILSPFERRLQARFVEEAKQMLADVHPFVIGITGSYGKTGAKAALGDLLTQCLAPTFWPRKSINTVMGITRAIREDLRPYHRYAVIEMGAYGIGSIKRLCDFTPPHAGLVTAVGIMHLERFGSQENVYTAKSELAQAVPETGILVCNGDNPGARRMAKQYDRATTLLYGLDPGNGPLDCYATDILFTPSGTTFTIHWQGQQYPGRTPLLGRPALSNILGAFAMACALGARPAYAVACMANFEPVDNRLVLDRKGSIAFLRDAYNSNPTGFEAALEVLGTLPATRRILITPGMIELGDRQYEENRRLARIAAGIVDLVIIVGTVNRDALVAGLHDAAYSVEKTITTHTRDEAFALLSERQRGGDLILIENDLGDLHEGVVRF